MRKRIWITGIAILAICILLPLLLRKRAEQPKLVQEERNETVTNQSPQLKQPRTTTVEAELNTSQSSAVPPIVTPTVPTTRGSNDVWERQLARWQAPIEFYGKVLDENSNPVARASVAFGWSEFPTVAGARRTNTYSDAEGLFSLHGQRGPALDIWVSKEGYYASHGGQKGFSYMNGDFSPVSQNPVIFSLRKKGTPAEGLVPMKQNYRVPRDGTPVSIDLVSGANTTGENGNLVVRCWTSDQGKRSGEKHDWRCILKIPGGGIVSTDEEFPFLAPENNYTPSAEINMPADRTDWKDDVDLKFFYRLADGRYGRMRFSMIAGGQHFCMIDSFLNPTGSRNLEPGN